MKEKARVILLYVLIMFIFAITGSVLNFIFPKFGEWFCWPLLVLLGTLYQIIYSRCDEMLLLVYVLLWPLYWAIIGWLVVFIVRLLTKWIKKLVPLIKEMKLK